MEEMRCSALVATFRARTSQGNSPERIQDSAEGPHGSLSTHCRLLLLLAPSRALAAPSRGASTSSVRQRLLFVYPAIRFIKVRDPS